MWGIVYRCVVYMNSRGTVYIIRWLCIWVERLLVVGVSVCEIGKGMC